MSTTRPLEGRVAIVTGAGRGIGRAEALLLAHYGAKVVVNDLGVAPDGSAPTSAPAESVAEEIRAAGGEAVADASDVADWDGAAGLVARAISAFGRLDVLVNNAGFLRDRTIVNMTPEEWDDVVRVHLRGAFAPAHFAAVYWRDQAKAGTPVDARIINTSSGSGLFPNPGQSNYGAAKSGVATFSIIAARELGRYGVTVNAIAPSALTRLTAPDSEGPPPPELDPRHVASLVAWLASPASREVTGRVFYVGRGTVSVLEGWRRGPSASKADGFWTPEELDRVVPGLVADTPEAGWAKQESQALTPVAAEDISS